MRCTAFAILIAITSCNAFGSSAGADRLGYAALYDRGVEARASGNYVRAEELFQRALEKRPESPDALLMLGMTHAFQEEWVLAERRLTHALEIAPDYTGVRIALARTRYWRGNFDAAQEVLHPTLRIRNPPAKALKLAGRIALARGEPARAERLLERAAAAGNGDGNLWIALGDARATLGSREEARSTYRRALQDANLREKVRSRIAGLERSTWRADVAGSYSDLSGRRESWRSADLTLSRDLGGDLVLGVGARVEDRGFATDTRVDVSVSKPFSEWALVRGGLAATPNADFLPRWRANVGAALRLTPEVTEGALDALWLVADARYAAFADLQATTLEPGLRQEFLDGLFALEGRAIGVEDSRAGFLTGWRLRVEARPAAHWTVFAGASVAPESEREIVPSRVQDALRGADLTRRSACADLSSAAAALNADSGDLGNALSCRGLIRSVDTTSVFAGVRMDLSDSTALTLTAARHDREGSYTRLVLAAALTLRF